MTTPAIFLDLDGVLADFDKRACEVLKTDNHYKFDFVWGAEEYWRRLNECEDFFLGMDTMPDAAELWNSVRHLKPRILTALPKTNSERCRGQKLAWVAENFGDDVPVITCFTADKPKYCFYGDVLIDDRAVNRNVWIARGGRFIVHTSAKDTIWQLHNMGVID